MARASAGRTGEEALQVTPCPTPVLPFGPGGRPCWWQSCRNFAQLHALNRQAEGVASELAAAPYGCLLTRELKSDTERLPGQLACRQPSISDLPVDRGPPFTLR